MGKVFISYRRQDSAGYVRALHNELAQHFGHEQIFMDVDDIPLGTDFVSILNRNLQDCNMMLVVIGPQWLDIRSSSGERRLDNPDDFVRLEVARALEHNFKIIPVLVNGATMPPESALPDNLKPLSRRQALELDNKYYKHGIADLKGALEAHLGKPESPAQKPQPIEPVTPPPAPVSAKSPVFKILAGVALLTLAGIGVSFWLGNAPESAGIQTPPAKQNTSTQPSNNQTTDTRLNAPATAQAGFDCRKAGTDVEDAICNDNETRKTDLELNRIFSKTIAQLPPGAQQMLDKRQKEWLKQRDNYIRQNCFSQSNQGLIANCIQRYYQQRITTLARIPANLLSRVKVLDPPTNIRATPNGDVICQIRQQQMIAVYNDAVQERDGDQWYPTQACGEQRWGVVHESQISAVR